MNLAASYKVDILERETLSYEDESGKFYLEMFVANLCVDRILHFDTQKLALALARIAMWLFKNPGAEEIIISTNNRGTEREKLKAALDQVADHMHKFNWKLLAVEVDAQWNINESYEYIYSTAVSGQGSWVLYSTDNSNAEKLEQLTILK